MNVIVTTDVLGWAEWALLLGAIGAVIASRPWATGDEGSRPTLLPRGWAGVAFWSDLGVAALAFVHGSVPMMARLAQQSNQMGLYLASVALLLAAGQVAIAWLWPRLRDGRWLGRIGLANLALIALLSVGHMLRNAGNLATVAR
jgi:hypothetical protein